MGCCCCCPLDYLPPVPENIQPDPGLSDVVEVVVCGFGMWSHDYGIWNKVYPDKAEDRQQRVWLWLNKSISGNTATIDLENFKRGYKPISKDKGLVLYSATMTERPAYSVHQRRLNDGGVCFYGIFGGGYQDPEDMHYFNHPAHQKKVPFGRLNWRNLFADHHIITKFSLTTKAEIRDGDLGRGEENFQLDPVILEVFAKGAVVTTYDREERQVKDRDSEGKGLLSSHTEIVWTKHETKLVDRVEYRLSFRGAFWAQWYVEGDSFNYGIADPTIECPLFRTTVEGGWFARSKYQTQTKAGVDPAIALLISHLCATEYSVQDIKNAINVHTPSVPPTMWFFPPPPTFSYNNGIQVHNDVTFVFQL